MVKVVIADRMGKGQNVAKGVEAQIDNSDSHHRHSATLPHGITGNSHAILGERKKSRIGILSEIKTEIS